MSGTKLSTHGFDPRRKQVLFRAWHRGMREMDLVMGGFADAALTGFSEEELVEFEALIELPDRDLLAWISGREAVPAEHDTAVFRRMRDFNHRPAAER